MHSIDWSASARLSAARGQDEFVVRERFAEEAPRIVIVCDRRRQMAHFAPPLPWLDKVEAMRNAVELVLASAGSAGAFVGYLDFADGDAHWRQPKGDRKMIEIRDERLWSDEFDGPVDWLERSVEHLASHPRAVSPGTFVFVISDFLPAPSRDLWLSAIAHRWDVVQVVIQDTLWEQSFPDVHGLVVPLRDPATGRQAPVRLRRKEVEARRAANEQRTVELVETFRLLDLDPVVITSSEKSEILAAFLDWTELRRTRRVIGA
jgi:uncharacterized protein (DUF58 family)